MTVTSELAERPAALYAALALAAMGSAGSVYLSLGMSLKPCPLCFYQRAFVMSVLSVLALGCLIDRARPSLYAILSLPSAVAGLGVALFHESLVLRGLLECPLGIFGAGTAPLQSLVIYLLLCAALVIAAFAGRARPPLVLAASIFGLALAWASVVSAPPMPPAPAAPYDSVKQPLEICRPPYSTPEPAA